MDLTLYKKIIEQVFYPMKVSHIELVSEERLLFEANSQGEELLLSNVLRPMIYVTLDNDYYTVFVGELLYSTKRDWMKYRKIHDLYAIQIDTIKNVYIMTYKLNENEYFSVSHPVM